MNRVAIKNEMIARRTTQVVVTLRSQGVQRRERSFLMATLRDRGFAGDLPRQAPYEWSNHSFRHFPYISSRKAVVAAMSDLIRGS